MRKSYTRSLLTLAALALLSGAALAATPGQPAPDFTLTDSEGRQHRLSDYRGRIVILEWLNHDCPYVRKYYNSGRMQELQQQYTGQGAVWFSIVSSAPGKQGYETAEGHNRLRREKNSRATAVLIDADGVVGRAYNARTTPQMVLITADGTLVYNGAIDDKPTARLADIEGAHNYLVAALDDVAAGRPVARATTQPYGCTVKY